MKHFLIPVFATVLGACAGLVPLASAFAGPTGAGTPWVETDVAYWHLDPQANESITTDIRKCERLGRSVAARNCYRDAFAYTLGKSQALYKSAIALLNPYWRTVVAGSDCAQEPDAGKAHSCMQAMFAREHDDLEANLGRQGVTSENMNQFLVDQSDTWIGAAFQGECARNKDVQDHEQAFQCLHGLLSKYAPELKRASEKMKSATYFAAEASLLGGACARKLGAKDCIGDFKKALAGVPSVDPSKVAYDPSPAHPGGLSAGEKGGVAGGSAVGVAGGKLGGTGTAPARNSDSGSPSPTDTTSRTPNGDYKCKTAEDCRKHALPYDLEDYGPDMNIPRMTSCPAPLAKYNCDGAMNGGRGSVATAAGIDDNQDRGCRAQLLREIGLETDRDVSVDEIVLTIPNVGQGTGNGSYDDVTIRGYVELMEANREARESGARAPKGTPACDALAYMHGTEAQTEIARLSDLYSNDHEKVVRAARQTYGVVEENALVDVGAFAVGRQVELAYETRLFQGVLGGQILGTRPAADYFDASPFMAEAYCLAGKPPSDGAVNKYTDLRKRLEKIRGKYAPLINDPQAAKGMALSYARSLTGIALGVDELEKKIKVLDSETHCDVRVGDCAKKQIELMELKERVESIKSSIPELTEGVNVRRPDTDAGCGADAAIPLYQALATIPSDLEWAKTHAGTDRCGYPLQSGGDIRAMDYIWSIQRHIEKDAIDRVRTACAKGTDSLRREGAKAISLDSLLDSYMGCADLDSKDAPAAQECSDRRSFARVLCHAYFANAVEKNKKIYHKMQMELLKAGIETAIMVATAGAGVIVKAGEELAEAAVVEGFELGGEELTLANVQAATRGAAIIERGEQIKKGIEVAEKGYDLNEHRERADHLINGPEDSEDLAEEEQRTVSDFHAGWHTYDQFSEEWARIKEVRQRNTFKSFDDSFAVFASYVLAKPALRSAAISDRNAAAVQRWLRRTVARRADTENAKDNADSQLFDAVDGIVTGHALNIDGRSIPLSDDQVETFKRLITEYENQG